MYITSQYWTTLVGMPILSSSSLVWRKNRKI